MIRRPPRSTQSRSSAASDVYKRQGIAYSTSAEMAREIGPFKTYNKNKKDMLRVIGNPVSYTHLRAHETPEHLVCRLLLEKKKHTNIQHNTTQQLDS